MTNIASPFIIFCVEDCPNQLDQRTTRTPSPLFFEAKCVLALDLRNPLRTFQLRQALALPPVKVLAAMLAFVFLRFLEQFRMAFLQPNPFAGALEETE